jgi:hypothetical protein
MPGKCQVFAKPDGSISVIYANHAKFSDEELTDEWFASQAAKNPFTANAVKVAEMDKDDLPWVGNEQATKYRSKVYSWNGQKIAEDLTKIPS